MKIMPNRLDRGYYLYQKEFEDKALEVLRSGWYVLGNEVKCFEEEYAQYVGSKNCVGVASGLDALYLAFRTLGIGEGDEVLVQGNTYIASVMGITMNGATPVFIEPNEFYNIDTARLEEKITERTKAILVVHLYGQASKMDDVMEIAHKYNLKVVEDCAQSHGAKYNGKTTGTFGDIGCFSFYPSKNLGGFGDGGCIVTDSDDIAKEVRILRNYGSEKRYYNKEIGVNSRLDELQAGLLRVRLKHLDILTKEREKIASVYLDKLKNEKIQLPEVQPGATSVWHQFVIRTECRTELIEHLNNKEVGTIIHYPIPPHLAEGYRYLGHKKGELPITESYADTVLSIPMYNGMTEEEQQYVIECMNAF